MLQREERKSCRSLPNDVRSSRWELAEFRSKTWRNGHLRGERHSNQGLSDSRILQRPHRPDEPIRRSYMEGDNFSSRYGRPSLCKGQGRNHRSRRLQVPRHPEIRLGSSQLHKTGLHLWCIPQWRHEVLFRQRPRRVDWIHQTSGKLAAFRTTIKQRIEFQSVVPPDWKVWGFWHFYKKNLTLRHEWTQKRRIRLFLDFF